VDSGGVVLICVRPQDVAAALKPLVFSRDTPVVSMVAGLSIARLQELIGPVTSLARAIPLPAVRNRAGITPVCPTTDEACCLFNALGATMPVAEEAVFDAFSAATATIAAHYQYLETVAAWLSAHGVAADDAARYVATVFAGAATSSSDSAPDLSARADGHATPDGINEQFRAILADAGLFALVDRALSTILDRLRGTQLDG
jgi:pyrroline-5-carboxylate reductase